jgi:hypothetical protein
MGFNREKFWSKRKVLMEGAHVVRQCHKYPVNAQNSQQAGHEIVFLDETEVHRNLTF